MDQNLFVAEVERTLRMEASSVSSLEESLDMDTMYKIVRIIARCHGKIILSGCGTSAMAARKIAHSLNCIERPALFLSPSDAIHGGLGVLQKEDILILISKGGNTAELLKMIPACKTKKAVLIGISENPGSAIAAASDIYLKICIDREPCRFNMLATASTLSVIAAFDAICIALMQETGYTKEQFAVIHPGGDVGERLTGKEHGL